jgi:hypothetical protein
MSSINEDYSVNNFRRNRTNVRDIPLLFGEHKITYPELYDNVYQEANIPHTRVEKIIINEPNNFKKEEEISVLQYPYKTRGREGWYSDTNFHRNELLNNAVKILEKPTR